MFAWKKNISSESKATSTISSICLAKKEVGSYLYGDVASIWHLTSKIF